MRRLIVSLLLVLGLNYSASMWLKKYEENYHRPTYYNKHHRTQDHVDYNREALDKRDEVEPTKRRHMPPFNPQRDLSYYVHVLDHGSVICAGAMISHRLVITSTRCFNPPVNDQSYEFKAKQMGIVSGAEFGMSDPHEVIAFYMPVSRDSQKANYVALLALASKLDRSYYRYIQIYRKIPKSGDKVKIAFVDPQDYKITYMDTMVLNYDRCQIDYSLKELFNVDTFEPFFICVRNKRHTMKATCSTRPGDPLIVGNKLAAINIYGENCDEEKDSVNMDIYLPMRPVVKFIQVATDSLRAFTRSGPYNESIPPTVSPLIESLMHKEPMIYVGGPPRAPDDE